MSKKDLVNGKLIENLNITIRELEDIRTLMSWHINKYSGHKDDCEQKYNKCTCGYISSMNLIREIGGFAGD